MLKIRKKFPIYKQHDKMDCGPSCLKIICDYYGKNILINTLRNLCSSSGRGISMRSISNAANKLGFDTTGLKVTAEQLTEVSLPCILHWKQNHFVVLYKIKDNVFYISDPQLGHVKYKKKIFVEEWINHSERELGYCLMLEPTDSFFSQKDEKKANIITFKSIIIELFKNKTLVFQLFLGIVLIICIQFITPFLTKSLVDYGIDFKDINFVYIVLIAQLMLFVGETVIGFLRSWLLLYISSIMNVKILVNFVGKIIRLPISYFETKTSGDFLQRISDQKRIESFITGPALNTVFSVLNVLIFGFVLATYNTAITVVFFVFTFIYIKWILLFINRRKTLDFKRFSLEGESQTYLLEMITHVNEIKLNNAEISRREKYEIIQAKLLDFKIENLKLTQLQSSGGTSINKLKNIFITFISVYMVIKGEISIGEMMAIQYIVGMVNSPIEQLFNFIYNLQDAKISLERISEIYDTSDEQSDEVLYRDQLVSGSIELNHVNFNYSNGNVALKDISVEFQKGKTTAIVGMSGSGKTTLLKLLLRFFSPTDGQITVEGQDLADINFVSWRNSCGVVMQESAIFSDTIEYNIAMSSVAVDQERLKYAIWLANLEEFVESQIFGVKTMLGATGNKLSQGQKQRIFLARAIYKLPNYIFLDEATNALDSKNENVIIERLENFAVDRTVVVIAHRLSTVKNADHIVVLKDGGIVEQGSHFELLQSNGEYFELVKNQMELNL
ncbi:MAG: peptidase domain-containing ABC transporter [Sphingobacterium sp.]|jgi:ATP-binding cassette subfamily B protein|nr:peptidase domain-containing ABC transporter [Sphingobacterium sp.]